MTASGVCLISIRSSTALAASSKAAGRRSLRAVATIRLSAMAAPKLGKQAPMFLYEDICEDPLGFVNEVLKLMDLPPHEGAIGDTGVKVLRDDISRQWRDRYVAHV